MNSVVDLFLACVFGVNGTERIHSNDKRRQHDANDHSGNLGSGRYYGAKRGAQ